MREIFEKCVPEKWKMELTIRQKVMLHVISFIASIVAFPPSFYLMDSALRRPFDVYFPLLFMLLYVVKTSAEIRRVDHGILSTMTCCLLSAGIIALFGLLALSKHGNVLEGIVAGVVMALGIMADNFLTKLYLAKSTRQIKHS
jgi:hypothetical protein